MSVTTGFGANFASEFLHVNHGELTRAGPDPLQSICPKCTKGVLFVTRDRRTNLLMRVDRCTFCAQGVIYDDEKIAGEMPLRLPSNFEQRLAVSIQTYTKTAKKASQT